MKDLVKTMYFSVTFLMVTVLILAFSMDKRIAISLESIERIEALEKKLEGLTK